MIVSLNKLGLAKSATCLVSLGLLVLGVACVGLLVRSCASKGVLAHAQAQAFCGSRGSRAAAEGDEEIACSLLAAR